MQGFGRWREWLDRAFPRGTDFARVLAEQAALTSESTAAVCGLIRAGTLDLNVSDARFASVEAASERNLASLHRSFSTPFDREDIFEAIGDLTWIAEYLDHAIREMVVMNLVADEAILDLLQMLEDGTGLLAEGYAALVDRRAEVLSLTQRISETDAAMRRRYEQGLGQLLVDGADPIDAMRRREIYHHLIDSGRRVRKAARVLSTIVIKDPS